MLEIDWQNVLSQHDRWFRTVVLVRVAEAAAVDEVMQEVALAAIRQQCCWPMPRKWLLGCIAWRRLNRSCIAAGKGRWAAN